MLISNLKRIGSTNRFHVFADEKYVGIFLDETILKEKIKIGAEFSEEKFAQIKEKNDEKVAFDMAVGYLEKYVTSKKGVVDYLKKKNFSRHAIEKCVKKLEEYGFVDDEKFAKNCFETLSNVHGKRNIAQKLRQKGVSNDIIENLISSIDEDEEFENAMKIAEKFVKNRQKDAKTKQKCFAHLIYKGYDISVASKVVNELNLGENDDRF